MMNDAPMIALFAIILGLLIASLLLISRKIVTRRARLLHSNVGKHVRVAWAHGEGTPVTVHAVASGKFAELSEDGRVFLVEATIEGPASHQKSKPIHDAIGSGIPMRSIRWIEDLDSGEQTRI